MSAWFQMLPYCRLAGTEHVNLRKVALPLFRKFYGSLQRFILQEDNLVHKGRI